MANVTIPNLTSATTIAPSTDLMVLEQTEGTRKATLSQIFTSSATSGSGLGITSGGVYTIKSGLDSDISDINTLLGNTSIASIGDGTATGAISKINSDLTDLSEYSESSFQRSSGTIIANALRRTGNSVNGIFVLQDNTVASRTSIAVIPEAYRPSHDKFGMCSFLINQVWTTLPIRIESNGLVTCPFMGTTTIPASIYLAVEYSLG